MKKVAAILLMGILVFNWYGYKLLSFYLENRADRRLEASLDVDRYDESQLISIKVPSSHLSYYNSTTQFERVDGQIEVGGIQYKYVKRRLFNDSIELLCIPNHTAMRLQTARNQFFQLVNDIQQHNGQSKKSDGHAAPKGFSPTDYDMVPCLTMGQPCAVIHSPEMRAGAPSLSTSYHFTVEQPPDFFSC
ncbi:hypothetical protein Q4E93_26630 [Flavitalea sp. BT771]|uniref:hypothetical protein n=1 Tax=Flavitalea sp. BT771 TaxID=3063329 RepID=UPI0026E4372B|nr:hypothetical protein [Flavitalea sp. BT771]MDO6434214.1 hypothetical protein [Flavitalea sp. BT771]MDV6223114.1 hypothetical protein [Flavitalea sp. BT771]